MLPITWTLLKFIIILIENPGFCVIVLYIRAPKLQWGMAAFMFFFFNFSLENNTSWLFLVLVELKGITKGWKALSLRSDSLRYFLLRCNAWFKYTVMFCSFCWNYYMSVNVTFFSREKGICHFRFNIKDRKTDYCLFIFLLQTGDKTIRPVVIPKLIAFDYKKRNLRNPWFLGTFKLSVPCTHHEPERTGSLKICKVWLLWSDVMVFGLRFHSRSVSIGPALLT